MDSLSGLSVITVAAGTDKTAGVQAAPEIFIEIIFDPHRHPPASRGGRLGRIVVAAP
jgi:hypothetical protein